MQSLKTAGYLCARGFDISEYAVAFCRQGALEVKQAGVLDIEQNYTGSEFDVIASNDVLYFIDRDK